MKLNSLQLNLLNKGDMPLPQRIVDSPLTLRELGAVVFLQAVSAGHCKLDHPRMQDPQMLLALKSLEGRGVFQVTANGARVGITIDLDRVLPPP